MKNISESLKNVFGSFSEMEATHKVESMVTHCKDTSTVYMPHTPFDKLNPGMELIKDFKKLRSIKKEALKNEDNLKRSMRRSLQQGKYIVRSNDWDWFVTFTFADHRYDLEKCSRRMEDWLENQQKRKGHFEYFIVIEFHDDEAIHFHALFQGYKGQIVKSINPDTGKQYRKKGRLVFNIPSYTLGLNFVNKCGATTKDDAKLCRYLNKLDQYLNKDARLFEKLSHRKRYWHTRGLKTPIREDNPSWYDPSVDPLWKKANEWGETRIYSKAQIDEMRSHFEELEG